MKNIWILIVSVFALSGCILPSSYVDPSYVNVSLSDVQPVNETYSANIEVEFQTNGEAKTGVNDLVKKHVESSLRTIGVILPTAEQSEFQIRVVVNNIANVDEAMQKGFATGLTFGLVGTLVTDYYEISISYMDASGTYHTKDYKHALHTTIGNEKAPFDNVAPMKPDEAFGVIVEELLIQFVVDLQKQGLLTLVHEPEFII